MVTHDPPTLDRQGLEVLDSDTCWALLAGAPVGRVAFVEDGHPTVLPVTHRVDGHAVVFRTDSGAKLSAAIMNRPVAFEVDGWDAVAEVGWSVLVKGVADTVLDPDELAHLDGLGLEPWATGIERREWVRIRPDEIGGRSIPAGG